MANNVLIGYYVSLVKKEQMKLSEVPDDVRELVESKLNGSDTTVIEPTISPNVVVPDYHCINGALNLEAVALAIANFNDDNSTVCKINKQDIFTSDVMVGKEDPLNLEYHLIVIENSYASFEKMPEVDVSTDENQNCIIAINGKLKPDIKVGEKILRVDVMIKSSNYEDMRLTVFFTL